MSNITLISDDKLSFQVSIGNNEGRLRRISTVESFFTDYGFVIPISSYSNLLLDYLDSNEDIRIPLDSPEKGVVLSAIVITKEGKLYNLGYVPDQAKFVTLPVQYGNGELHAISDVASLELAGLMALKLSNNDLGEATSLLSKCFWVRPSDTKIIHIPTIVKELNIRNTPKSIFKTVKLPS